ncbi:MAG: septation protein SpoVG family protein [Candidatus Omnitrophica bacterium]|nr:septation protein SpoVG family protein [Candidatus Omnitrophota bacterium]
MKTLISISEIQIIPVKPNNGLIAFASCVVNNQFYIGNIAIYTSLSSQAGYRLVYPTKVLPNGKALSCIYPINKIVGSAVQEAIINKYEDLMKKVVGKNEAINAGL